MKSKVMVSIVIPVYNCEKYIKRCLDSILKQTYENIKIIIINDGSSDNSKKIIENYKSKYPNIKFIDQKNMGVSNTRNKAIRLVETKYVMFIDNDDFIDNDYVKKLLEMAESNNNDVVISGYRRTDENNNIIKEVRLKSEEWSKMMILSPWAKIYKTKYLIDNNIEFLDNNIGEDIYFNLQALFLTDKITIIDYIGYNWFYNNKSISNTIHKNITNLQIYELLNASYKILNLKKVIDKNYEIIEMEFIKLIIWVLMYSTKKLPYSLISEEYDKIFKWLEKYFPNYKRNKLIKFNST